MPKKYKHMTDEELDRLFKDAAENFRNSNPPEGAWEAFYTKYGKQLKDSGEDPVRDFDEKPARFFTIAKVNRAAAVLLLLFAACAVVWLMVSKKNTQQKNNEAGSITKIPAAAADTTGTVATGIQEDTVSIDARHSLKGERGILTAGNLHLSRTTGTAPTGSITSLVTEQHIADPDAAKNTVAPIMPVLPEQKEKATANVVQQGEKNRLDRAAAPGGNPDKNNYTGSNFFAAGKEPQKRNSSGRWQLGIVGGTNIAMVKGDVSATPGLNTGILVQHRINDSRVSVESGVIYESMTYAVENEYFNPGGKPVSSKVSNISGSCTMIDVPVNVRYDMVHSKKRKAFVSTGVSPTVMVKQSYVYDYTDEKGTRLIDRDVTGQGKNFYAVANVSVGYEQKWNKTSVQVAPYLKIPMGEIGYGNLSLGGIGTQVSIKRDL